MLSSASIGYGIDQEEADQEHKESWAAHGIRSTYKLACSDGNLKRNGRPEGNRMVWTLVVEG